MQKWPPGAPFGDHFCMIAMVGGRVEGHRLSTLWTGPVGELHPCKSDYFHWVSRPKPATMKPNPTKMFQPPSALIGRAALLT